MRADITRNTFLEANHISRVLFQQGRVQLDADFNEQVSILLHYLQALAADVIGPHGGPCGNCAFAVLTLKAIDNENLSVPEKLIPNDNNDFLISMGRYYVDGIACEVDQSILYHNHAQQNGLGLKRGELFPALVYLDVWERLLTSIEYPLMREVALGGPDTAARAQVVWQVKVDHVDATTDAGDKPGDVTDEKWRKFWSERTAAWQPPNRGRMRAMCQNPAPGAEDDPCIIPPDNRYRGPENQLYRVEIHHGGEEKEATFKWSRDNGSVVFPIRKTMGELVFLEHLGRDARSTLNEGDWVEIVDDQYELAGAYVELREADLKLRPLLQIAEVDRMARRVKLKVPPDVPSYKEETGNHPLLRRWDHRFNPSNRDTWRDDAEQGDGILVQEGNWLPLEYGIQIYFEPAKQNELRHMYRRGDYWLIPARTMLGDIEWPNDPEDSTRKAALPPHGIDHHYAPLALVKSDGTVTDLRHMFPALAKKQEDVCKEDMPVLRRLEEATIEQKTTPKSTSRSTITRKK